MEKVVDIYRFSNRPVAQISLRFWTRHNKTPERGRERRERERERERERGR
jgi:hypothetical protein